MRLRAVLQALIDSPDITRTVINFKRLTLTDITIEIERTPKKKALVEAFAKAGACKRTINWALGFAKIFRMRNVPAAMQREGLPTDAAQCRDRVSMSERIACIHGGLLKRPVLPPTAGRKLHS